MAARRLTERVIDDLEPESGAQFVQWDRDLKGFGVRVSPAGAKAFTLKYRLASLRVRWKTLGRVGEMALDKARRHAKDDIGIVARGGDPLSGVDAARGALTVETVGQRFFLSYVWYPFLPARGPWEHPDGVVAIGLSVACVYLRYHYAVDVFAGFAVAAVAGVVGYALTRRPRLP